MLSKYEVKATVIICAYNAEARIYETIRHLCGQEISGSQPDFEILIVDNASTDCTQAIVRDSFEKNNFNGIRWRIVKEYRAGLAHARRRGILEAAGEVVVFVDDDNSLHPEYVRRAIKLMQQNEKVGIIGGANAPKFEVEPPAWFYSYAPCFAVGVQGLRAGNVSDRGFVWGAGMVLRRRILADFFRAGGDLILKGRTKTETLSGDDSEICKLYLLAGYELAYDHNLVLKHSMPANRLTIETLERMLSDGALSVAVLRVYEALLIVYPSDYRSRIGKAARCRAVLMGLVALSKIELSMAKCIMRNVRIIRRISIACKNGKANKVSVN